MREGVESLGRIRAKGIALLLVTFGAGVLAGVAGERIRSARSEPAPRGPGAPPGRFAEERLPFVFRQLDLTGEQRARVFEIMRRHQPRTQAILSDMLPRLRAVTDSVHAEVREVLTPAQLERWDSLMAEMHGRHGPMMRRGVRGRRMGPGPPPPYAPPGPEHIDGTGELP